MLTTSGRAIASICLTFQRGIRRKADGIDGILQESLKTTKLNCEMTNTKTKSTKNINEEFKFDVNTINEDEKSESSAKEIAKKIRYSQMDKDNVEKSKRINKYCKMLHYTDFDHYKDIEIARILRRSVMYSDNQFVIINKPYGLPVHGGENSEKNIRSCLTYLSRMIYGPASNVPLHLCNRLDKMTTGVLIYAIDKDVEGRVMAAFREQKVLKKFWAVTVGSPEPSEGVIDIPLVERRVQGVAGTKEHTRVTVKPYNRYNEDYSEVVRVPVNRAWSATTWYRVLDQTNSVSLVELQPLSNHKHQLRVHLSQALNCPILGDHKYSHSDRLAPQRLPGSVFRKYKLTSSKTRHIPLHLHLREVIIPNVFDREKKRHLHVISKYSSHFYHTLKLFRLKPGPPTEWHRFKRANRDPRKEEDNPLFIDPTREEEQASIKEEDSWESMSKNSFDVFTNLKSRSYFKE